MRISLLTAITVLVVASAARAQEVPFPLPHELESTEFGSVRLGQVGDQEFEVYDDMSGHVGSWALLGCATDAMTDDSQCLVQNRAILADRRVGTGPLTLLYGEDGLLAIYLSRGGRETVTSDQYIRLDSEEPLVAPPGSAWLGSDAESLLTRLLEANRVRTRYFDSDAPVDAEIPTLGDTGFPEAVRVVSWWLANR